VAMDYHLDWLFASIQLSFDSTKRIFPIEDDCISANQQDVDLLVAFERENETHIVLLEAKALTGWSNEQLNSKAKRLSKIFGKDGKRWQNIVPHFILISPNISKGLSSREWPEWMAPNGLIKWITLPGTEKKESVYRCDEKGKSSKDGRYWTIKKR